MNTYLNLVILTLCLPFALSSFVKPMVEDPDLYRNAPEIIKSRGFGVEIHYVTTTDGYILTLHRVVNPYYKGSPRPVLLQHGLISSGVDFIINSPGENVSPAHSTDACDQKLPIKGVGNNLGFALSKLGFDVWLGNSRGNVYSTNHTTLSPKGKKFWQFSFDEMIDYDQPAVIDYILKVTNQSSLGYVGHSQGTLTMFGLLSTQPKYANIVKPFIALGPVASLFHVKSPIKYLVDVPFLMQGMMHNGGPFFIPDNLINFLGRTICKNEHVFVCKNILFLLAGYDCSQVNKTRLPVYLNHAPAGTSNWNMVHFMQMLKSKILKRFDYGWRTNLKVYGKLTPPAYQLSNINSTNIALLYGENDFLADPYDVKYLKKSLKVPLLEDYLVPNRKWNHIDFLWAQKAGFYANTKIANILLQSLDCKKN